MHSQKTQDMITIASESNINCISNDTLQNHRHTQKREKQMKRLNEVHKSEDLHSDNLHKYQ